jgi:ABC-type glycerol-3-phosphate transport system permease component
MAEYLYSFPRVFLLSWFLACFKRGRLRRMPLRIGASLVMTAAPVVFMYFALQKHTIKGIAAGAANG